MNEDTAFASLGPCEDYEFELADLVDGTLAPERISAVRGHLEGCARCRVFVQTSRELDHALVAAMPRVQLSPDFDARLRERIAAVTRRVPKEVALARAENEYVAALRTLRDGLRWRTALNAVAGAAVGAGVLVGIGDALPSVLASLGVPALTPVTGMGAGLSIAAACIVAGLLVARTRASYLPAE